MANGNQPQANAAAALAAAKAAVQADYESSQQAKREANTVIATANGIIGPAPAAPAPAPTPVQRKAHEARVKAREAIGFADQTATAWENFFLAPTGPNASAEEGRARVNAGKADTALGEAQALLEEVKGMAGLNVRPVEELIAEIVQFRKDTGEARKSVRETASKVREIHKNTPSAVTPAAVTAVGNLETQVQTDYGNARRAEDAAKVPGANRATINAAHAAARNAKATAEAKVLLADDELTKLDSIEAPPAANQTTKEKAVAESKGWFMARIAAFVAIGLGIIVLLVAMAFGLPGSVVTFAVIGLLVVLAMTALPPATARRAGVGFLAVMIILFCLAFAFRDGIGGSGGSSNQTEPTPTVVVRGIIVSGATFEATPPHPTEEPAETPSPTETSED